MKGDLLDWARGEGEADRVVRDLEIYLRRRRRRRLCAGAAMLALLVAAGSAWRLRVASPSSPAEVMAANAVVIQPEVRRLPDGSTMELKPGAEIAADFSGPLRRVVLQRGEVFFHVAKNPQRPFVVEAAGVEVRAVGTAFSVQLGTQAVAVLVTEGRVAVNEPVEPVRAQSLVDAGNRLIVGLGRDSGRKAAEPPVALSSDEIKDRLSWRIPRLEFNGTPLAEALPMFNRYCRAKLRLGDPSLGRLQLSGVLRADDADSVLQLLEGEFGIAADRHGDEIVLHRP